MAKLTFIFGTMGSAKTAQALMKRHNYIENGMKVLLLKPSIDVRNGINFVTSRAGDLKAEATLFDKKYSLLKKLFDIIIDSDVIIIDEVQFASPKNIEDFKKITEKFNIDVFAYGLRTDFTSHTFPASKRLFELADEIVGLNSFCHCGNDAIINARYDESGIIYKGDQVEIGGNERYKPLCYKCYKKGNLI